MQRKHRNPNQVGVGEAQNSHRKSLGFEWSGHGPGPGHGSGHGHGSMYRTALRRNEYPPERPERPERPLPLYDGGRRPHPSRQGIPLDSRIDGHGHSHGGHPDNRSRYPRDYHRSAGGGGGGGGPSASEFYQSSRSRNDHYFGGGGPARMRSPSFIGTPYSRNDGGYPSSSSRSAPTIDFRVPPQIPFSSRQPMSASSSGRTGPDYPLQSRFPPSGRHTPRSSIRIDGPGRYDSYSRPSIDTFRPPIDTYRPSIDTYRSAPHHSSPSLMASMGGKRMRSPQRYPNPRSLIISRRTGSHNNRRADGVRDQASLISAAKRHEKSEKVGENAGRRDNREGVVDMHTAGADVNVNVNADVDVDVREEDIEEGEEKSDSDDDDASSFEREEVEMEIERVDNAIAKQERILATARTKIAAAERIAREKAAGIESQEKVRQRLLPDSIMEEYRARHLEHITEVPASTAQLIGDIYAANRKLNRVFQEKSKERDMILFNIGNLDLTCGEDVKEALMKLEPTPPVTPALQQFNRHFNPSVRPLLVNHIRKKMFEVQTEKEVLIEEYREYEVEWNAKVEKMEADMEKSGIGFPVKPLLSQQSVSNIAGTGLLSGNAPAAAFQPEESAQSSLSSSVNASGRSSRRTGFRSDVVRSEAEWQNALSFLGILPEDNANEANKAFSSDKLAKEVEMITDPDIIRSMKFVDYNNLVHDPEKELQDCNNLMEIKWSEYEKSIFKSKLMEYGKDFYKIASFLDQKSTQDCVTYYYREKVNLRFKNLLRRSQSGRGKRKKEQNESDIAPPSFKSILLMDDEDLVPPPFDFSDSSENEGDDQTAPIEDARKPFILDPLSAPVSPLGSPALIDQQNSQWTEEEMNRALRGFELFGRDFHSVSSMIGTKTPYQCKSFFNNHRRHVKDEKDKGQQQVVSGKRRSKGGRKRAASFSVLPLGNALGVEGIEDPGDSANEKKRKSSEVGEGLVKKAKKSDDSATATTGAATAAAGGDVVADTQPRRTISYWSVSERSEFMRLLPVHGKNFEAISLDIQTKSTIQVRNYFHNSRKKLNLDALLESHGHPGSRTRSDSSHGLVKESLAVSKVHPAVTVAAGEHSYEYHPYGAGTGTGTFSTNVNHISFLGPPHDIQHHYTHDSLPPAPIFSAPSPYNSHGPQSAYSDHYSSTSSYPYYQPPLDANEIAGVGNMADVSRFMPPPLPYCEDEGGYHLVSVAYSPSPSPARPDVDVVDVAVAVSEEGEVENGLIAGHVEMGVWP